jgi:phage shock protein E
MFDFLKKIFGGSSSNQNEIKDIIAAGAVIIDVRGTAEFAAGHVKGAVNIPLDKIPSSIAKIKNYKKPIVLCCVSGRRAGMAQQTLKQNGIENTYNAGSWQSLN